MATRFQEAVQAKDWSTVAEMVRHYTRTSTDRPKESATGTGDAFCEWLASGFWTGEESPESVAAEWDEDHAENETSLITILRGLPDTILLSDGGTDWSPDCLIDVLRDAPESITRDYVLGETEDGRITITALNAAGYLESIPAFTQRID